jgi:RNAse (barnase) inhibitor barstar
MENENNFVDTSSADFATQFKAPDMDFQDDFFGDEGLQEQDDVQENFDEFDNPIDNEDDDYLESNDNNDSENTTGNPVLDSYLQWAIERNIDVRNQGIDVDNFDAESMDKLVGEYYIQKKLGGVDPRIAELSEQGISLDEYMQHKNYLQGIANQDPVQLYKASMYDHLLKSESALGSINIDQQGNPDEASMKYLVNEVERRIQNMHPDAIKQRGQQIQQSYMQEINRLPDNLIQQQQHKYTSELQRYNTEVEELTGLFKDRLSKSDNLVIDFSGQSEKDDFINYMKQNLEIHNYQGQQVVPLLHRLQNDAEYLATTMRLLHMHDKGYFTDLKNMERNAAFKKLSVTPVLSKNSKQQSTGGPGKYVDTSDPNYLKKFKR